MGVMLSFELLMDDLQAHIGGVNVDAGAGGAGVGGWWH